MSANLFLGDAIGFIKTVEDNSIPMILTDIPYDEVNKKGIAGLGSKFKKARSLHKGDADIVTFDLDKLVVEFVRIVSGSVYVFCGIEQVSKIRAGFTEGGLSTRLIVWEKTNPSPMLGQHMWLSGIEVCVFGRKKKATFNAFCENSVLRFPTQRLKGHPTPKPIALFEKLIKVSSNPGDLIFDPFAGSGTTGVASLNLGRRFLGCELNPEYFEFAKKRIEQAKENNRFLFKELPIEEGSNICNPNLNHI